MKLDGGGGNATRLIQVDLFPFFFCDGMDSSGESEHQLQHAQKFKV